MHVWRPVPGMASAHAPVRPRAPDMVGPRARSSRRQRDTVSEPVLPRAPADLPGCALADLPGCAPVSRSALGPADPRERSSPR